MPSVKPVREIIIMIKPKILTVAIERLSVGAKTGTVDQNILDAMASPFFVVAKDPPRVASKLQRPGHAWRMTKGRYKQSIMTRRTTC